MSARITRFERLLNLREHQLTERRTEQSRAEAAQSEARIALEKHQQALREAALGFRVPEGQTRAAQDFIAHSDWLQTQVKALEKATIRFNQAKERVRQTVALRVRAEQEKRKVELLLGKIREEVRAEAVRQDQKDTDELAAQKKLAQSLP